MVLIIDIKYVILYIYGFDAQENRGGCIAITTMQSAYLAVNLCCHLVENKAVYLMRTALIPRCADPPKYSHISNRNSHICN